MSQGPGAHGFDRTALEARGLTKDFGTVRAVSDLSFAVPRGSITGFLGPNGSGKTTTLRMLLGLIEPTAGVGLVGGMPLNRLTHPARVVGAVLDSRSLHPKRTAIGHLRIYTAAIGLPDARADDVLRTVGLSDVGRRPVGAFSLGMRQRLALATALLGDPEILVLDEPANGLDPEGIAWLRDFLKAFAASGRTVLISSHILREVEATVNNLVIVSTGALVYQGSVEQLRASRPSRTLVTVSDPAALALALASNGITNAQLMPDGRLGVAGSDNDTITRVAHDAGVTVFGTTYEHVDLEQVFLSMTTGQYTASPAWPGPQSYGPPNYGPPAHDPPAYGPPAHDPPAYGPPAYGPPAYQPPPQGPPGYGPPTAESPWNGNRR